VQLRQVLAHGVRHCLVGRVLDAQRRSNLAGYESSIRHRAQLHEPHAVWELLQQVNQLPAITLIGLMAIGPLTDDEDRIRKSFGVARSIFERGRDQFGADFDTLSMGMSGDFALAIAEGSTMLRVGTGLFGLRPQ
jgi:uncharacterized pyridoxal phosphate-containing UPF0001 family protein